MTESEVLQAEAVVIGAGVVGLATARALALQGRDVMVLEAGDHFGEGISSRNSEVIHAGLYYPAGSAKERLCLAGREKLYRYCAQHQISHRRLGKYIVAAAAQAGELEPILQRASANGTPLERVASTRLKKVLPGVRADAALYSPETGIVDSHGLMRALLGDLEAAGGQLALKTPVHSVHSENGEHRLVIGGPAPCILVSPCVVNAAGLHSVALARNWRGYPQSLRPRQSLARGSYFSYSGRHPFETLVYPVPEPGGLGIHLTLDLAGQARFGPDVQWLEHEDYQVPAGRKAHFVKAIQQWWPALDERRLQPAYAGIRPKLTGPGGGFADFCIQDEREHGLRGVVQLFGIESPGLTASLALADEVAVRLG